MVARDRRRLPALIACFSLLLVALAMNSSPALSTATTAHASAPDVQADIPAAADSTVDSLSADANFGSDPRLAVGHNARPLGEQRSLVRFDLGSLPAGAVIDAAQLHLNLAEFTGTAPVVLTPYLLTASWSETGVTWNNQPSSSTAAVSQSIPAAAGEYTWDVTGLAQTWQAGRNFGLVLRGPEGTGDSYARSFSSRNSREPAPHLVVTYHLHATNTPTPTNTPKPPTATPTATPVDTTPPTNPTVTANRPANAWSNQPAIVMSWSGASDGRGSGVYGYSYQWATSAGALPDAVMDTTSTSVSTTIPQDGASWYFLVRTVDNAGNWAQIASKAGPYPLDTVPPDNPVLTTDPAPGVWSKDNSISASWTNGTDNPGGSGIAGYSTLFSQNAKDKPDNVIDTTWNTDGSGIVADGDWYFTLLTGDNAGNWTPSKVGLGPIKVDATPPTSYVGLGNHEVVKATTNYFEVRVSGGDNVSGVKAIVVQYQDTTVKSGWLQWKADAQPGGVYTYYGKSGHLYCFRTQATDNAGNVEDWPAQADMCVAAATADLIADRVVLTQGIQDDNRDAALIAGRRTFARCYVHAASGSYDDVSASLVVRDNQGGWLGALKPLNPSGVTTVKQFPNRGALNDSFYFEVPAAWVTTAGNSYLCRVNSPEKYWETDANNNTTSLVTNAIQAPPPLKLFVVDINYWYLGQLRTPRWDDYWAIESYLKRMYPITQLQMQAAYLDPPYSGLPSSDTALDDLTDVWISEILWGSMDPTLYWYGMIGNQQGNVGGLAWRPGHVAVGSVGPQAQGCSISDGPWDLDDSCGDHVAAHEIGHSLGRKHVKCTGTEANADASYPYPGGKISSATSWSDPATWYGFDAEDNRLMGPTWTDIMGYCKNQWISNYTYFALYNAIRSTSTQGAAVTAALAEPRSEYLWVAASVSPTDAVTLYPFKRIPDGANVLPATGGEYSVRLLGAGGAVLADYPVEVRFDPPEAPGALAALVPWLADTREVAIYHGAAKLAGRPVTANPPSVTLLAPNGGERLEGANVTVRWQGTDPDGGTLSYDVEYSKDGGAHWRLLATRLTGNEATLSLDRLPGTQHGRFRVWASDGVNTARDASDGDITVPSNPPVAGILSPRDGASISYGQLLTFDGSATDPEDGSVGEGALRWSSDLAGPLGTGALLQTSELITGTHVITLSAMDNDGQIGSATVRVFVDSQPVYLPLIQR